MEQDRTNTKLQLSEKSLKTFDEEADELTSAFSIMAAVGMIPSAAAQNLLNAMIEFLHWTHDETGMHASLTDMLEKSLAAQDMKAGKPMHYDA